MNFFKMELIIYFVFLTFHDTYAPKGDPGSGNIQIPLTSSQDQGSGQIKTTHSSNPDSGTKDIPLTSSQDQGSGQIKTTHSSNPDSGTKDIPLTSSQGSGQKNITYKGNPGSGNIQIPLTSSQRSDNLPMGEEDKCVVQLGEIKYAPEKTFLDHYLRIFNGFNLEEDFLNYDSLVKSTVTRCLAEPESVLDWQLLFDFGNYLVNSVSHLFCTVANKLASAAIRTLCSYDPEPKYQGANEETSENDETEDEIEENAISKRGLEFFCDLLIMIHGIYDFDNAYNYCEDHNNYETTPTDDDILECQEVLQNEGFIFTRGLDNYAFYLLKLEKAKDILIDGMAAQGKKYKDKYIAYLKEEVQKRSHLPGNTRIWCQITGCENELTNNGFPNRMSGRENFKAIEHTHGGNCHGISGSPKSIEYCNYLNTNAPDATMVLHGTYDWCVFKVQNKTVLIVHITEE